MDDAQSCFLTGTKWNDENSLLSHVSKLPNYVSKLFNYELSEKKMIRESSVALKG